MLDVIAIHYFACIKGTKPFEVLLLEGQDGQTWKDHMQMKNMNTIKNFKTSKDCTLMDGFPFHEN